MRLLTALALAAALPGLPPLQAQDSVIVIGASQVEQAAANGFVFLLGERVFGSRCFSASGQNNGRGVWARAVSEGLNGYAQSICRHHGFSPKRLQNGWRVRAVSTTQSCQYKDGSQWRTLSGGQCIFAVRTTPAVGSTSAIFEADVIVSGRIGQDRRATLTWRIEIQGPAGKSPWVAQTPSPAALVSPANTLRVTTGSVEFSWTAPASGATDYRLCISRESFTGACEQRARVTTTRAGAIAVPFRGDRVRWFVEACNSLGCTASVERRIIVNTLPNAVLVSPPHGSTAANRTPTFQWQVVPGAQTYELYVYHSQPLQEFRLRNLSSNVTQFTPASGSPLTLASPVYWMVFACTQAVGCGSATESAHIRTLNLPPLVKFSTDLAPTFKHARCTSCHAVEATGYARGTGGLPSNHIVVNGGTNCAQANCHVSSLLPTEGSITPGWHAPASGMDLRNKTDYQLCLAAQNPGSAAPDALQHLTQDKLILWAVGSGKVPGNKILTTAPPNRIDTFRDRVSAWVAAGKPCN
ncbi:MAG TPA: hypothetical protein VMN37_03635 [Gemmatimonadales bacterium]|nr:hypothetical protein [Gemmatimonadales bacterium]